MCHLTKNKKKEELNLFFVLGSGSSEICTMIYYPEDLQYFYTEFEDDNKFEDDSGDDDDDDDDNKDGITMVILILIFLLVIYVLMINQKKTE